PLLFAVDNNPWDLAVGDFNGDGATDLAVTNYGSKDVSILLNDGIWPPSPRGAGRQAGARAAFFATVPSERGTGAAALLRSEPAGDGPCPGRPPLPLGTAHVGALFAGGAVESASSALPARRALLQPVAADDWLAAAAWAQPVAAWWEWLG